MARAILDAIAALRGGSLAAAARLVLAALATAQGIVLALALVVVLTPPLARVQGDRLQIALPLLALACAANAGRAQAQEFLVRYLVMFVTAHGFKRGLGEAEINRRPSGSLQGFPSAHTSTAVLGASALVHECLRNAPLASAGVILAAGFVGASRIEARKHDIWQVLAGALLGLACDRAFRRPSPARARIVAALRAGAAWSGRGLALIRAALAEGARRAWRGLVARVRAGRAAAARRTRPPG